MMSSRGLRQRQMWDGDTAATGFTLIELVFALALSIVLVGVAIPVGADALDDMRTRAAARYVAGRIASSRLGAINRSRAIGLRFVPGSPDYQFGAYVDGNGNGYERSRFKAELTFRLAHPASSELTFAVFTSG